MLRISLNFYPPFLILYIVTTLYSQLTDTSDHPFTFSDTLTLYRVYSDSTLSSVKFLIQKELRTSGDRQAHRAVALLRQAFDSLGYFSTRWDTCDGVITITAGNRFRIDSVIVSSSPLPLPRDLWSADRFPVWYESGFIREIITAMSTYLADHGFPFASIVCDIEPVPAVSHADSIAVRQALTVQLRIQSGKRALFSYVHFPDECRTDRRLLSRDIDFRGGDTFCLSKVNASIQHLASRRYIESASLGTLSVLPLTADSVLKESAAGLTNEYIDAVAVGFALSDRSGLGVDGSIGFQSKTGSTQTATVSGLLNLSLLNLFYRGEEAHVYYRGEDRVQQFESTFVIPYPKMLPCILSTSVGLEIEKESFGYFHGMVDVSTFIADFWRIGLSGVGSETTDQRRSSTSHYYGVNGTMKKQRQQNRLYQPDAYLSISTGIGLADRAEGMFRRYTFDFSAGGHMPIAGSPGAGSPGAGSPGAATSGSGGYGIEGLVCTRTISTQQNDSLLAVERIRVGGFASIRGYAENQFSFASVAYVQTTHHYYFSSTGQGSLFLFADGGVGFPQNNSVDASSLVPMFGAGLGITLPVGQNRFSIAWGRHYKEQRGFGRIHIRFINAYGGD